MTIPRIEDASTDHTADIEAIRRVIADAERAFNSNDADLLVAHFAENATAVGVTGTRIVGRAAALEASRAAFEGPLRDQRARYEIADIVFVRHDVALVHKNARAVDGSGAPIGIGHAMTALYVLVEEAGGWWVVSRQNTLTAGEA